MCHFYIYIYMIVYPVCNYVSCKMISVMKAKNILLDMEYW